MTEKTEASKYSDPEPEEPELPDYTLARAVEEVHSVREQCLRIRSELLKDQHRFRSAMNAELKERNRKLDLNDWLMIIGLSMVGIGVAVAAHWAYSLVVMGTVIGSLSVLPLLRRPAK